jgi:acyl carrier protein
MSKKSKENIERQLFSFFIKKNNKLKLKNIKKINLIKSGVLDSLDILDLVSFIKKKFKTNLDISDHKILKQCEKFKAIIKLIKN